MGPAKHRCSSC